MDNQTNNATKPTLPAAHNITLINPALSGVIIGTIVKNNIPIPSDKINASHNLCLAIMLANINIEMNIPTNRILLIILIVTWNAVAPSKTKGRPEIAPPSIDPKKKAIIIHAPATKQTTDFEIA